MLECWTKAFLSILGLHHQIVYLILSNESVALLLGALYFHLFALEYGFEWYQMGGL